jgi:uncharacterized protein (DUF427 family)
VTTRSPEQVASYPRPPRLELIDGEVSVDLGGACIAKADHYHRVLETFHPPTIYLPPEAFLPGTLHAASGRPSFCEWKGLASYWDLSRPDDQAPTEPFAAIAGWISLYPAAVDGCWLEGEPVIPQPGSFYGGWITSWIAGPFKGDPLHPELI